MHRRKGGLQISVAWKNDEGGGGAQGAPPKGMKGEDAYVKVC